MDLMAIGVILGAARVWDAINDPLVGMFIDRAHTSKTAKRCARYLKWMPIPIGIMAMMMFVNVGLEGWLMVAFVTGMYFFGIPSIPSRISPNGA